MHKIFVLFSLKDLINFALYLLKFLSTNMIFLTPLDLAMAAIDRPNPLRSSY